VTSLLDPTLLLIRSSLLCCRATRLFVAERQLFRLSSSFNCSLIERACSRSSYECHCRSPIDLSTPVKTRICHTSAYLSRERLIASEEANIVAKQNEQEPERWARLKQLRLNKKQAAQVEKEVAKADKETDRAENKKKQLERLEQLHPDLCESTHPRATHAQWANVVKRRGVRFKSNYATVYCWHCREKVPAGANSWVMRKQSKKTAGRGSRGLRKKINIHFCERCGISPADDRQLRTPKKIADPPSPSYFRSPGRVRLYSGQRKN
jgi:hypothetical protein